MDALAPVDTVAMVAQVVQVVPEVLVGRVDPADLVDLVGLVGLVDPMDLVELVALVDLKDLADLVGLKDLVDLEGLGVPQGRLEARVVQVATQGREATARVLHRRTPVLEARVPRLEVRVLTWEEVQQGLDPEVGELEVMASVLVLAHILAMETPDHKVDQALLAVATVVVRPGLARHRRNILDPLDPVDIPVRAAPPVRDHLDLVAIPAQEALVLDPLDPEAIPARAVPVPDRLALADTPAPVVLVQGLQDPVRNLEEAQLGKVPSTQARTVAALVAMGATTRPEEAVHTRTVRHPTPRKAITLSSPEVLLKGLAVGVGADDRRVATEHP